MSVCLRGQLRLMLEWARLGLNHFETFRSVEEVLLKNLRSPFLPPGQRTKTALWYRI